MKERASLADCFDASMRFDGLNYNTTRANTSTSICNVRLQCRVMFCKLLILLDKLRVALEWIHSQASRRRDWSQSRPINGRKLYRVQSSSSEPAEPHKMRDNQSSRRRDAQGLQGYRVAEPRAMRAKRNRYRARQQGLTSSTECATLQSIEQTKERRNTKHESRIQCEN